MTGSPFWDAVAFGVLGLLVGSFLNVVIHRLPRMMQRQWDEEYAQYASEHNATQQPAAPADAAPRYNLCTPASHCPTCRRAIRWYENIPVLSYLVLRGRCAGCGTHISLRYPLVEIATGLLFFGCANQWGASLPTLLWCGFAAALLAAALIDWDTTLLPDDITLPLLWAGLIAATLRWIPVPLADAVLGAAGGYLSLWCVYWAFKLATGKEGMGYGDFKLFAALGAWFGWQALVPIILLASVAGIIIGLLLKLRHGLREGKYVPFGPFLAVGGLAAMLLGPQRIMHAILSVLGLAI